jgi:hypothetical protein
LRVITTLTDTGNKTTETVQLLEPSGAPLFIKEIVTLNKRNSETVKLNSLQIPDDTFTTKVFTDQRENKSVRVTVINIKKLQSIGNWPENNLLYASREDSLPDVSPEDGIPDSNRNPGGILIINGGTLEHPLILVSNNPIYIQGDFNRHQKNDGTVLIDDNPEYGNTDIDQWKPAAVIGDAITLLSNAWTGNSFTVAADTEYNMAMVPGTVKEPVRAGFISQLLRFLENWDGKNAKIRGSVTQLWNSQYATGNQRYGSPVYTNPKLDFSIDNSFSVNSLPPSFYDFFPGTTERVEERNWKRILDQQSLIYRDLKKLGVF